jgi:hypothetical protein
MGIIVPKIAGGLHLKNNAIIEEATLYLNIMEKNII